MTTVPVLLAAAAPVLAASVEPAPEDVSPGVLGFLVTLAIVLACIPLFRSMTAKVRGVRYRDGAHDGAGPAGDAAMDAAVPAGAAVPPDGAGPLGGTSADVAAPVPPADEPADRAGEPSGRAGA